MKTIYIHFLILLAVMSLNLTRSTFKHNVSSLLIDETTKTVTTPSDLFNLEAVKKDNKVEIFWGLKSELHHDYFTLERSANGVTFEKIATIDAGGNTNNLIQYIETDHKPLKGRSYYRLKLTDIKNKSTYSNVIMLDEKKNCSFSMKKGTQKINFKKIENSQVLVVLRDGNGKEHYSKVQVIPEDSKIIGIDKEHKLTPGTYLITGTSHNALYSHKMTVR